MQHSSGTVSGIAGSAAACSLPQIQAKHTCVRHVRCREAIRGGHLESTPPPSGAHHQELVILLGSCQDTCLRAALDSGSCAMLLQPPVFHAGAVSAFVHLCGSCCPRNLLSETYITATLLSYTNPQLLFIETRNACCQGASSVASIESVDHFQTTVRQVAAHRCTLEAIYASRILV